MIAMVQEGQVVSAYVGDVNTQEIYGFRPGSMNVHRITEFETAERLAYVKGPLRAQTLLLRDPPEVYSEISRRLLPFFKSYEIEGGSIGISLARLWKREVAGVLLPPGGETPWDSTPIKGISKRLGYLFLKPSDTSFGWQVWTSPLPKDVALRDHNVLVIHREDYEALLSSFPGDLKKGEIERG